MFSVIIIMANRLQSCCFVFLWIVEIHGFEVRATKLGALVDDALCPAVAQSFEKIFISLLLMNVFTVVYRYSLLFWNIFFFCFITLFKLSADTFLRTAQTYRTT